MSRFLVWALALVSILPTLAAGQPVLGAEFQVNTYTYFAQWRPAVATDSSGNFVVVWTSQYQDGSSDGIFGQQFDSAGTPQGAEFQVNTYTSGSQRYPALAADSSGNFVVVWEASDGSSQGVFGRQFDSAGTPQGAEFQVNTYTTSSQAHPAVAADSSGNFVVVWDSYFQDGGLNGVFGRRFDSAGTPQGAEFQVNTYTTGPQSYAAVAMGSSGFVVVWASSGQDGDSSGVFGRRFDSAGTPQGNEFQVNTYTTGPQLGAAAATGSGGNFVVTWTDGLQVFGQRFDSAGTPQGAEFPVSTSLVTLVLRSAVAASSGNFAVVWANGGDGDSFGVFGRQFDSGGTPQGPEFQVNTYTTSAQGSPAVAMDGGGNFVVVWNSYLQDGFGLGIFGQRLAPDGDGIPAPADNCPFETNPDVLDSDDDGAGDVCDPCPLLAPNTCDPDRSGGTSIGAAGGAFTTPDGSITVDVPVGVLSSGTSISVTESVAGFVFDPEGSFSALYRVGLAPDSQHFSQPVTITFRWDDRDSDGRVDRGTCEGGEDVGLSCDENGDCPASTCSIVSNPQEGSLLLKRNAQRFGKNGFGATPAEAVCSGHQAGGGCETAVADCTDAAGTGMATVAKCCDTVNNEWVFQTCDFSEFSIGDLETIVLPAVSPAGWTVLSGLLMLAMGWVLRRRQAAYGIRRDE